MKSVMISIRPKWCELIASGKKTVEVRKTKPKIETPFKVYIYCTKDGKNLIKGDISTTIDFVAVNGGKVIGEFVCNDIENFRFDALEMSYMARKYRDTKLLSEEFFKGTQVTYQEAYDYCEGMTFDEEDTEYFYGWHISDLVIYDKQRELSEFRTPCKMGEMLCGLCDYAVHGMDGDLIDCNTSLTRPPQSWCYVEVQ